MYIIVYFKISKLKNQIRISTNTLTRKQWYTDNKLNTTINNNSYNVYTIFTTWERERERERDTMRADIFINISYKST
jgi:hypothetical protein